MEWKLYEAEFIEKADNKIEWAQKELDKIRVGRISPKIIEEVEVDAYGEPSKLLELANIMVPDAKTLAIKPYDKSTIKLIASTLNKLNLGGNIQVDAELIRITFPSPTEEIRKEAATKVKKIIEQAKVFVRDVRHDLLSSIKKDDELNEDSLRWYKEELDAITKKFTNSLDEIQVKKTDSIMKI